MVLSDASNISIQFKFFHDFVFDEIHLLMEKKEIVNKMCKIVFGCPSSFIFCSVFYYKNPRMVFNTIL